MKIRTKLMITASCSTATAAIVGAVIFLSLQGLNAVRGEAALIQTLQKEVAELRSTTFEYLTYHERRMYLQWLSKHARLTELLGGLRDEHKDADAIIEDIRRDHKDVGDLFGKMTGSPLETGGDGVRKPAATMRPDPSTREREVILGGQLLMRTQYIVSNLLRLSAHTGGVMAEAQERMALAVVLSTLFLVAVIAATSLTIMKSLLKPIEELRRGTERVGSGDLDFRVGTERPDEIGDLSRSFDRMAGALSEKEAELRQRADQLETANKELEAFSYSVSHDLRAPLRHVSGYIDLLKRNASGALDEKGRHYVDMITESGVKMGHLIDDLLSFSRMARVEMRDEKVALGDLLPEVLDDLREDTRGRVIAWETEPLPEVRGDPSMLRVALSNLVSNAVKFTRPRPEARIRVGWIEGKGGEVTVFVRDNGVGFDMKYVDKLFGVFQRLHSAAEFEGTGVGLANVRRIVHRHGGNTWAEGAVGEGATFFFTIHRYGGES
jgi:signal transduction histidine kinase